MKTLVAGSTGFIGRTLVHHLLERGNDVVALARHITAAREVLPGAATIAEWDGRTIGPWTSHLASADAVINLSGASIGVGRWTAKRKREIIGSRVDTTRLIVAALQSSPTKPRVLINISAIGYYGMAGSGQVTEAFPAGIDFLASTCEQWESEALRARELGIRVVLPRLGVVFGRGGGVLTRMVLPFHFFVGGPLGSGNQWYPWVHIDDVVSAVEFLLVHPAIEGPVNVVSPETDTMSDIARELGKALNRPSWLPVPGVVFKFLFGEMSGIILKGREILPQRLLEAGFAYRYPHLSEALAASIG